MIEQRERWDGGGRSTFTGQRQLDGTIRYTEGVVT